MIESIIFRWVICVEEKRENISCKPIRSIRFLRLHETEGTGKNRSQRIVIHYKFVGIIEIPASPGSYTADTRKGVAVSYVTQSA